MAQLVVRNLEQSVKVRLQRRAKCHGHSMEEEVREILRIAANETDRPEKGLGSEIAALVKGTGLKFEAKEFRGYSVKPISFDDDSNQ